MEPLAKAREDTIKRTKKEEEEEEQKEKNDNDGKQQQQQQKRALYQCFTCKKEIWLQRNSKTTLELFQMEPLE
jgi:hypothetical protein